MNSGPEQVVSASGEGDVTVNRHWGVELINSKGQVFTTRWDPGYGSGVYVPYNEAEARADLAREEPGYTKRLVTRTETTLVVTTPWERVPDKSHVCVPECRPNKHIAFKGRQALEALEAQED